MKDGKKKQPDERASFRDHAGVTLLSFIEVVASGLMTNMFLLYLTDYAGLGMDGAAFGTILMLVSRIFDAVMGMCAGVIMDRAAYGRFGKYRPYFFVSILGTSIGMSLMFSIPGKLSEAPGLAMAWVILFYVIYSTAFSFASPMLLYRTITLDPKERSRLMIGPRMASLAVGILLSMIMRIITGVNRQIGNMHRSFGLVAAAFLAGAGVISLIGLFLVREKHEIKADKKEKVCFSDIFSLVRENGALRVRMLSNVFSGFVWTLLFAGAPYYIKWNFCTDLATGVVNSELLGTMTMILGAISILPMIIGTLVAGPLMKLFGGPKRFSLFLRLLEGIPCGLIFLFHLLGISNPVLFTSMVFLVSAGMGLSYIPAGVMSMETMDYQTYRFGTDRSALCSACDKFVAKTQQALSSSIVAGLLLGIGYKVDSVTDAFIGDVSKIPQMMTGMTVIMGLIPFVLSLIAFLILTKYPITEEIRQKMRK